MVYNRTRLLVALYNRLYLFPIYMHINVSHLRNLYLYKPVKDRQQEKRPVLVWSHYNRNYYFPHNDPYMYYIPLKTEIMAFLLV